MTIQPSEITPERVAATQDKTFLGNLKVSGKLAALTLALGIPLIATAGLIAGNYLNEANIARNSASVSRLVAPAQDTQRLIRTIRNLDPNQVTKEQIAEFRDSTARMNKFISEIKSPEINEKVKPFVEKVVKLVDSIESKNITKDQLFKTTGDLQIEAGKVFTPIADVGKLLNTPSLEENKVAALTTKTMPQILPRLGRSFGAGERMANEAISNQKGKLDAAQRASIEAQLAEARLDVDRWEGEVNAALAFPGAKAAFGNQITDAIKVTRESYDYIENNILKPPIITVTPEQIHQNVPKYLDAQYKAFKAASDYLSNIFAQKQQYANQRLLMVGIIATLLALGIYLLSRLITLSILQPIRRLTDASQKLAQGELQIHVPITTSDELGTLTSSFNDAAQQLRTNAERVELERIEQERLQNNIGDFLDVTMDIAEGDLTRRGRVTEDVMGNVVDSINLMTEELGSVLKDVQNASNSVATGSGTMMASTRRMTQGTEQVVEEAGRVSQQMQGLITDIRRMAQSAQQSAETARLALEASQQGQSAVTDTLEGMQTIRREVQTISKRIKGLGDRSLEIQEIVDTISQIADQTNLLAVNASIEAVGAGEAGSRFAIVADEVRKLADTSSQATGRIATLIKSIQTEVQDVIVNVEESTREVEQGYRVAGTAGERLREIGTLTEQSAQLAEQISAATSEQVRDVEQMGQAVQQITEISDQAGQAVREGEAVAEQLQQLAQQLNGSLRRFRLPS